MQANKKQSSEVTKIGSARVYVIDITGYK